MPYDAEIEDSFGSNSNLTAEKARGILYLLESKLREVAGSQTVLHPFTKYTLEHLMPQKWEENWAMPDGLNELEESEFKKNRNKAIATLGNMAIITQGLNSKASNNKWKKKLDGGLKDKAGDLLTMKDVVNKSKWDESTIASRAEWLAGKANEVWENVISSGEAEEEEMEKAKIKLDRTQYSFDNGTTYHSKGEFIKSFVKAYIEKHPTLTIDQIKAVFPDSILTGYIRIGVICTEEEINTKVLPKTHRKPTKEELIRWYNIDDKDAWLTAAGGTKFIVNNQMTKKSADKVRAIAEADGFVIKTK